MKKFLRTKLFLKHKVSGGTLIHRDDFLADRFGLNEIVEALLKLVNKTNKKYKVIRISMTEVGGDGK